MAGELWALNATRGIFRHCDIDFIEVFEVAV